MEKEIVILHISQVDDDPSSGVAVVVPEHLKYQSKYAKIGLLMINKNKNIKSNKYFKVFEFNKNYFDIKSLSHPFNQPDLIVFHELYRLPYIKLSKEASDKKIPYIIVPHGGLAKQAQKMKWYKKYPFNKLVLRSFYKSARAIQFLSKQEKDNSIVVNFNSFVSGNGVNIYNNKQKKNTGDNLKLIFIGRYSIYHKGLDVLIKACSLIREEMESKKITINLYGVGDEKNELLSMVSNLNLDHIIKVNDGVYGRNKQEIIRNADFFIQTSRFEGQPLALLEALSLGTPIIATPGTTMTGEIKKYELGITTELDEKKIGQSILDAYNHKQIIQQFSENAVKFIAEHYSWEIIGKKTIEKYSKLLRGDVK